MEIERSLPWRKRNPWACLGLADGQLRNAPGFVPLTFRFNLSSKYFKKMSKIALPHLINSAF